MLCDAIGTWIVLHYCNKQGIAITRNGSFIHSLVTKSFPNRWSQPVTLPRLRNGELADQNVTKGNYITITLCAGS